MIVLRLKYFLRVNFHPAEREKLFSQVLKGSSEVIDGVVDDEETVVEPVAFPDRDRRILAVVPFNVEGQRCRDPSRDNLRRRTLRSFR